MRGPLQNLLSGNKMVSFLRIISRCHQSSRSGMMHFSCQAFFTISHFLGLKWVAWLSEAKVKRRECQQVDRPDQYYRWLLGLTSNIDDYLWRIQTASAILHIFSWCSSLCLLMYTVLFHWICLLTEAMKPRKKRGRKRKNGIASCGKWLPSVSVHATVDGDVEVNYSPQNPWASKIEFALHKGQSHLQMNRTFQPRVGHLAVFTAVIWCFCSAGTWGFLSVRSFWWCFCSTRTWGAMWWCFCSTRTGWGYVVMFLFH